MMRLLLIFAVSGWSVTLMAQGSLFDQATQALKSYSAQTAPSQVGEPAAPVQPIKQEIDSTNVPPAAAPPVEEEKIDYNSAEAMTRRSDAIQAIRNLQKEFKSEEDCKSRCSEEALDGKVFMHFFASCLLEHNLTEKDIDANSDDAQKNREQKNEMLKKGRLCSNPDKNNGCYKCYISYRTPPESLHDKNSSSEKSDERANDKTVLQPNAPTGAR